MQPGLSSFWSTQYRLVLVSGFGTYLGRWIETIVGTWLILEMTDSPFLVGLRSEVGVSPFRGHRMIAGAVPVQDGLSQTRSCGD